MTLRHRIRAIAALIIVAVVSIFAGYKALNIKFSYDFERYLPNDDEVAYFKSFRKTFLTDNERIFLGIPMEDGNALSASNLKKLDTLTHLLNSDTTLKNVVSLTNAQVPAKTPFGYIKISVIDRTDGADSARLASFPHILGTLVSADLKSVSLILTTNWNISKKEADKLSERISEYINDAGFNLHYLVGRSVDQAHNSNKLVSELILFTSLAAVIVCVLLAFLYRTLWGVLIPLSVVTLSAIWMIGFMAMTGKDIDVLMTLVPTILFVVGVSDLIHLITRYISEREKNITRSKALLTSFREVGLATFITSLTTAIGFLSLATSPMRPIREFGLYTASGVLFAFILAFTILPSVITLAGDQLFIRKSSKIASTRFMSGIFLFVIRKRKWITGIAVTLTVLSVALLPKLNNDHYITEELPQNDPIKQGYAFYEKLFSGVRNIEIGITTRDGSGLLSNDNIQQISDLENVVDSIYKAGMVQSPATMIKLINYAENFGNPYAFTIPENYTRELEIPNLLGVKASRRLVADSGNLGRLSGVMLDIGGKEFLKRTQSLEKIAKAQFPNLDIRVTGIAYIMDLNNRKVSENLIVSMAIAFLVVSLIMALLYRNLIIVLIALVPNVIPLLFTAALMVLADINLNISTSLIFTVLFGIAVDDTIHVLSKLRVELSKGRSTLYALKRAMISTGRALIITSIILCAGFISLIFSDFSSTFHIGVLISFGLWVALISDLTILPILLMKFRKKHYAGSWK